MIPIQQVDATPVHPLARFVTKEAIALLLRVELQEKRSTALDIADY